LYRYPFWVDEFQVLHDRLGHGDVFIDGGANIGLFTLVAAKQVGPLGRVIAVEPGPVCSSLERNVELNLFDNVDIVQVALGSTSSVRTLTVFEGDCAGLSSFAPGITGGVSMDVPVRRLDDLVPPELVRRVRLVKLDLEGAEVDALRGATRLLETSRADFLVEVEPAHLSRQGASSDQLLEFFRDFDRSDFTDSPNVLFTRR